MIPSSGDCKSEWLGRLDSVETNTAFATQPHRASTVAAPDFTRWH